MKVKSTVVAIGGGGVALVAIAAFFIAYLQTESIEITKEFDQTTSSTVALSPSSSPQSSSSSSPSTTADQGFMVTDGLRHSIPLNKIRSGGPPKDGIPSIDNPKFAKAADADFISDSDTVIGLEINGQTKAYPLFILVWHEIVNDIVGGVPVAVTYCPLCYTNQVFERVIDGQDVEFGTSGKLYNSNLVMYDRLTDSYWSQALGSAITGEQTGHQLKIIPFDIIKWGDWKKLHPETVVLTKDTGHIRSYGVDPYGNYYTDTRLIFPVDNDDNRMHPKEVILGFRQGDTHKAYRQRDLELSQLINDQINDRPILLVSLFSQNARAFERTVDGGMNLEFDYLDGKLVDTQTNSQWNYDGLATSGPMLGTQLNRLAFNPGFWFEWVAFHPDTEVYGGMVTP